MRALRPLSLSVLVLLLSVGHLPMPSGAQVPVLPGLPQSGPDIPAVPVDVVEVVVHENMRWSFTEGWRTGTVQVPESWDRAFVELRIWPEGDPWDRLFAVHVAGMEVLHGTTPRTDMTIEKEITEFGALLPGGGNITAGLYLGTWVGALRSTLTLRFHLTDPIGDVVPPRDHALPAFLANWHCDNDLATTVTFPNGTPSAAVIELYTSGHGGEEFWWTTPQLPHRWRVFVDDVLMADVHSVPPYTYAFLGFTDPFGSLVHGPMWWTAQQGLDVLGVHTGVGEIPPYRTLVLNEEQLSMLTGARTIHVETIGTRCAWMTSVNFLLDG